MIIFDYANIATRMHNLTTEHDRDADRWSEAASLFHLTVAANLNPYQIEDDWDEESKDSAKRVNARIAAAKRKLG